jgi:cytochrome c biogenesis protein CcdA
LREQNSALVNKSRRQGLKFNNSTDSTSSWKGVHETEVEADTPTSLSKAWQKKKHKRVDHTLPKPSIELGPSQMATYIAAILVIIGIIAFLAALLWLFSTPSATPQYRQTIILYLVSGAIIAVGGVILFLALRRYWLRQKS